MRRLRSDCRLIEERLRHSADNIDLPTEHRPAVYVRCGGGRPWRYRVDGGHPEAEIGQTRGVSNSFFVVPSAYVVFRRGTEVLLQLRQNTGYMDGHWACGAAGHVEANESVQQAAVRESWEELAVGIDAADLEPVCAMHRAGRPGHPTSERVDFFFAVDTWSGSPRIAEPSKSGDLRWHDLAGLPADVVPHERFVLDGLRTGELPAIAQFGFSS